MKLSGFSLPVEHFSASSLAMAVRCPERWRRRYLLKEREATHSGRFIGIVDHHVHAENFEQKIESGEDLTLDYMRGKYRARWASHIEKEEEKNGPIQWNGSDPDSLLGTGLLMMEAYHTQVSPSVVPQKVEERFEESIPGVPRPLLGYMDVVEADQIIERKTSNRKVTKPKAEWRFQGRIYQMVADLPTSWHVVTSQVTPQLFTPDGYPSLFLAKGNPDVTLTMIQQSVRRLNDLYERYGPDSTWPTEGVLSADWYCDYCSYQETGCPAWVLP